MKLARYDKGRFLELKKIDAELYSISEKMKFLAINPTNIAEAREQVLADPSTEPQFTYDKYPYDLEEMKDYLKSIDRQESVMGDILEAKRKEYLNKCEMMQNRGSEKFTGSSRKVYGMPDKHLVEKAMPLLQFKSEKLKKDISTKRAMDILKAEMLHYGFDYTVVEREMSATADVNVVERKLSLKSRHKFSMTYLQQLIFHEIGTHVLRAENGRLQPFRIFVYGLPDYLGTEEGLAVVNEERFGLLNAARLKKYAARTVAVHMSADKSFSEIYNFLREFLGDKSAFTITLRAKRGTGDAGRRGGCTKDHLYLDGYYRVREYLDRGGSLRNLYYGKVGVGHAKGISKIHGLSRPRYLPENQSFKSLLEFVK